MKPRWQASELIRTRSRSTNTRMRKRRRKGDGCSYLAASPAFPGLPTLLRLPTDDKSPENHLFFLFFLGGYSDTTLLFIFPRRSPPDLLMSWESKFDLHGNKVHPFRLSARALYVGMGTNLLIHQLKRNKISGITFHTLPPACAACLLACNSNQFQPGKLPCRQHEPPKPHKEEAATASCST